MNPKRISKFFQDLRRDISDRRLLVPLVALAVAIVAVPMLLTSDAEPPAAPTPPPADLSGSTAVDAAVTVSGSGVRNYRRRLEGLRSKNPFDQQYTDTPGGGGGEQQVTGSGLPDSGTPTDSTATSTGGSGNATITDIPVDTGPTTDPGAPSDPGTQTTEPTDESEVETTVRFYADRVDVKVGPIGKTKTVRDVRHLDFLPDDKTPIVAFLGLAGGPDHAMFSVSPQVIETRGEGSCAPKGADGCQYLTLGIGDERFFKYGFGADAETYRLKLVDTDIVRIPDPRDDRDRAQQDAADDSAE